MQIELDIPSNLSDITLKQYKRYIKLIEDSDGYVNRFMSLKMLEIFCNVPYETAKDFKFKDINKLVNHLMTILDEKPDLVQSFKIGDTEFGFIPKLDDMTFGEYIDLDNSLSDWDNMHKAMAVLYRPIKKKIGKFYTIKKYTGDNYYEAMEYTPMDAVMSSIVFFYRLGTDLSKLTMNYLTDQQNQIPLTQTLEENGVGINQFTHSLKEMLDDLTILHR